MRVDRLLLIADHAGTFFVKNAGRNKPEDELSLADADGMTGVMAP